MRDRPNRSTACREVIDSHDFSPPLLVATPNIQNHIVWSQVFWLDPTHVRPYPRPLLERLGEAAGFLVLASFDDANTRPRRAPGRAAIALVRSLLSGVDKRGRRTRSWCCGARRRPTS